MKDQERNKLYNFLNGTPSGPSPLSDLLQSIEASVSDEDDEPGEDYWQDFNARLWQRIDEKQAKKTPNWLRYFFPSIALVATAWLVALLFIPIETSSMDRLQTLDTEAMNLLVMAYDTEDAFAFTTVDDALEMGDQGFSYELRGTIALEELLDNDGYGFDNSFYLDDTDLLELDLNQNDLESFKNAWSERGS